VAERGVGAGGPEEVVAVEQDRRQQQDPVDRPLATGRAERGRHRPPLPDVLRAADEPPGHDGEVGQQPAAPLSLGQRGRPEQVAAHGHADGARDQVACPAGQQGHRRPALPAPGDEMNREPGQAAEERDDRAGRRRHRVRHHQRVLAHYVREGGGQRGQEEPVDAQDRQHAYVQGYPEPARGHQVSGQGHEGGPQHGRPDQDLPSRPAVDEHAGERPDQRVWQVQDGEGGRGGTGVGEAGRVEEHVRAEAGREHAVAGLRDQPGREQAAEVPLSQDGAQVSKEGVLRPRPPPGEAPGGHRSPSGRGARGHRKGTRPDYPPPTHVQRLSASSAAASRAAASSASHRLSQAGHCLLTGRAPVPPRLATGA